MWVLSIGQIIQQVTIAELALCGSFGGNFCIMRESKLQCQISIHLTWLFWLMPDWLAVPVSLDRLNAILFPIWYREHCTMKAAWLVIIPLYLLIGAALIPKFLRINSHQYMHTYT
ncbi:uncharacterized protein LOC142343036 [Convolutriloba macropyga]|uniref:uncharacterized protein LOC142343036 n=1 Tax=Convolutriloba macropyga TaxID=536237 RepID=UPI003F525C7F